MKYSIGFVIGWLCILTALLQQWILLAGVLVIVFSIYYPTHSLLVLGLLLDGYFGAFYGVPVFSLMALCWFLAVESVRDQLNVRQDFDV